MNKVFLLVVGLMVTWTAGQSTNDMFLTPSNIVQKDARGPGRYAYSANILVGLNSTLSLTTLNHSKAVYWALTQRLTNSSSSVSSQLFMLGNPDIRTNNPALRSTYQCSPNETECYTITVNSLKLPSIGNYIYQSLINIDSFYVDYNVSAWIQPLDFQCGAIAAIEANLTTNNQPPLCSVNRTLGLVSVLGSSRVTVTCSILVAQNDVYDPQVDVVIRSVEDNTECSDTETTQVRIMPPFLASTILAPLQPANSTQQVNTVLYRLSRNCTRIFTKAALNSHLTCSLQPRVQQQQQQLPVELRPVGPYTSISMSMDVQYPPEFSAPPSLPFNRTMIVNSSSPSPLFSCPFESNPPPQFEWRVSLVALNRTDSSPNRRRIEQTDFLTAGKDYVVPRDLEVGLYGFECRARTLGLVNKYSDTVKFYLNVIPVPVSSKKASQANVGAIVGGVIGGVLAITVIVLLVLFLIRRHRNGSKDEPEKAKDNRDAQRQSRQPPNIPDNSVIHAGDDESDGGGDAGPGTGTTHTLSGSSSLEANETASLAANKASPSNLPHLDYLRRQQQHQQDADANVTLSSTSLSNRIESTGFPVRNTSVIPPPNNHQRIDDITTSAHEFIFNPNNNNGGIPASSHSNYEARRRDAASPDANPHSLHRPQGSVPGGIKVLPTTTSTSTSSHTNDTNSSTTSSGGSSSRPMISNTNNLPQPPQQPPPQPPKITTTTTTTIPTPTTTTLNSTKLINPQNHLESPPPYDSALHNQQQQPAKKDSSMMLQNQQKDYMGSNSRLLMGSGSGSNTPTLIHKNPNGGSSMGMSGGGGMPQSHSYTGAPHQLGLGMQNPSTPSNGALQQMQYPGSGNLQYTTVQNLARNRQPLSGPTVAADMDPQAAATQYTTMTQLNPIDV